LIQEAYAGKLEVNGGAGRLVIHGVLKVELESKDSARVDGGAMV
jgi:hypothetical protein